MAISLASPLAANNPAPHITPAGHSLTVAVEGLRNTRGNLLVCITAHATAFPDCSRDPGATRVRIAAADLNRDMRFTLPAGTYAVAIVHDENGNGRLDTMMMMPREGFGFSRNPRLRLGPPRFADAAFPLTRDAVDQHVRVRYML